MIVNQYDIAEIQRILQLEGTVEEELKAIHSLNDTIREEREKSIALVDDLLRELCKEMSNE